MKILKKLLSVGLSFAMIMPFSKSIVNADGEGEYQVLTSPQEIPMDVDILVLETPGTDAEKFLKRFFDKNAPYYEKDENGQTTSIMNDASFQRPKKFEMMKAPLQKVEDWDNFPDKSFYEKIDYSTFKFECKYYLETVNTGRKLYTYNTTFKIFHIDSPEGINNPEIAKYLKDCSGIFELFDLKGEFFDINNVKAIIDGMRQIDNKHYDMPILDNCEIGQTQFQIEFPELEQYFLDKCCNYTFFNHDTGKDMLLANWNFVSSGTLWYPKNKKRNYINFANVKKVGLGVFCTGAILGVGYGVYEGIKKIPIKKNIKLETILNKIKNLI